MSILVNDVALDVQDNAELIIYAYDGTYIATVFCTFFDFSIFLFS